MKVLFNLSSRKGALSYDESHGLKNNERREVKKNKYIIRSRISEKKFREILKYFTEDIEATKIANLTGISRIYINKILKSIRILMSKECEKISKFSGEISSL